tara:strand:+ start:335 stop:706 length:372 start_codon:yes stop_codon:yes gene_type:complete
MSVNGKALEYFTIKVNNGFSVEDLAYLILGWENDYKKIKKIKSYSKLMNIAKKQLMDKGLIWLECPTENLEYDIDGVANVHIKVMQHIRDVEPSKYLDKTTDEIKQVKLEKQFIENMNVINGK